jgi:hypothetical protein
LRDIDAVLRGDVVPFIHPVTDRLTSRRDLDVGHIGVWEELLRLRFKPSFGSMPAMFDWPVRMKRCAGLSAAEASETSASVMRMKCFMV